MNKSVYSLVIILLVVGCNVRNESSNAPITDTLAYLTKTVWNIDLTGIDSLQVYNHTPLYFNQRHNSTYMYFYNNRAGEYKLVKDSLIVKEISYIHSVDTFIRQEKIRLIAKIIKINTDSLILQKIGGRGFPFIHKTTYRYLPNLTTLKFYNDTLTFSHQTNFEKIVLSSSLCYGECPAQAVEISSNGDYKFYGGKYSELKGYYSGSVPNKFIDSLKYLLSAAIVNRNNLSNSPPIDASESDILIIFPNRDTLKIFGDPYDFPYRLHELYLKIMKSYKLAEIQSVQTSIDFATKSHIYDTTMIPPPPPLPPPVLDKLDLVDMNY